MLEAERLGYNSVWSGEAYGTDAVTPTAWILARTTRIRAGTGIMQMQARTPACTAMTALTLQALSNNRFLLGIGASGPQVVEGWHGVPFGKPMARTREYIEILRKILKREAALQHDGELYQIPYRGAGATGLGKPLKSILHGDPNMPIYAASITPIGLRTAGEVADGVLPIFMSPEKTKMVTEPLLAGIAKGPAGRSLADFDVAPYVRIAMGNDLQACREALKPELALYIGGMGARTKNFYNDFTKHLGYEEAAVKIQDAFLSGKRAEAIAAVPDTLVDEVSLVGSPDRIKDRLQAWKEAGTEERGRLDAAERRDGRTRCASSPKRCSEARACRTFLSDFFHEFGTLHVVLDPVGVIAAAPCRSAAASSGADQHLVGFYAVSITYFILLFFDRRRPAPAHGAQHADAGVPARGLSHAPFCCIYTTCITSLTTAGLAALSRQRERDYPCWRGRPTSRYCPAGS